MVRRSFGFGLGLGHRSLAALAMLDAFRLYEIPHRLHRDWACCNAGRRL
jgi:hypothetical protein